MARKSRRNGARSSYRHAYRYRPSSSYDVPVWFILLALAGVAGLIGEMVACQAGASLAHTVEIALGCAVAAPAFVALLAACTEDR